MLNGKGVSLNHCRRMVKRIMIKKLNGRQTNQPTKNDYHKPTNCRCSLKFLRTTDLENDS
eukprot:TRINITY_DN6104_c0_g1_i1.p2 TRINITY_DN6104_c0_g1~~TRINITY_DN6104_c0_g1_i1.p2  ORF type:complete len:60 (+),score=3.23 TRINITY_DN6104_c0_g1_i1:507-686(+)